MQEIFAKDRISTIYCKFKASHTIIDSIANSIEKRELTHLKKRKTYSFIGGINGDRAHAT